EPTAVWHNEVARSVAVAWWTDAVGRVHVRVAAEAWKRSRETHRWPRDPFFSELRRRPPLWLTNPERVFLRLGAGPAGLLCCCAGGAAGPPKALAWTGECCGPCHDHLTERAEAPPVAEMAPAARGQLVESLAISPDRQRVAVFRYTEDFVGLLDVAS